MPNNLRSLIQKFGEKLQESRAGGMEQNHQQPVSLGTGLRNLAQGVSDVYNKDLPFYRRMLKSKINRAVLPGVPFNEKQWMMPDEWKELMDRPVPLRERFDYSSPQTKPASAQVVPYRLPPTMTAEEKELQQITFDAHNLRPAARKYFSTIPIKIGKQYLEGRDNVLGMARGQMVNPNLPWFIGIDPVTARTSGTEATNVPIHEYGHMAPWIQKVPEDVSPSTAAIQGISRQWKTGDPNTIYSEAFAQRALPWEAYEHIFQSPEGYNYNRPQYEDAARDSRVFGKMKNRLESKKRRIK